MQRLIDFILKFKEHFVFVGFLFISLSLILLGDINKIGGFRTFVVATIGWFQKNVFFIPNITGLKNENAALRELNFSLSQKLMNARISEIENQSLRNLLGLKQRLEYPVEVAEVLGSLNIDMRNFIIIDKGKQNGLDKFMTVRNDAGLVGSIALCGEKHSLVELILNANVKVPAIDLRSGVAGVVNWDGSNRLLLRDVVKFLDVKVGDTIVTSKHSLKFVPFVPIGTVESRKEEEGELFSTILVKPFVNFSFLEEVFVIKKVVDPEIINIVREYEEIVKKINLPPEKSQKLKPQQMMKEKKRQETLDNKMNAK
ncbi:MAG: rod shape-determining protein MreC [Candidatus Kapaibacteriota bacterium]|jgi:rod shape-determining protein MreC